MDLAALPTSDSSVSQEIGMYGAQPRVITYCTEHIPYSKRPLGLEKLSRRGNLEGFSKGPLGGAFVQGIWISRPVWGGLREFFFSFLFFEFEYGLVLIELSWVWGTRMDRDGCVHRLHTVL